MIGSRRGKGLLVIPDNWEGGTGREKEIGQRKGRRRKGRRREREKRLLKPYS